MKNSFLTTTFISLLLFASSSLVNIANAGVITLNSILDGRHGPSSSSKTNDYSNSPYHAGFRVFDLSGITGTITSAHLFLGSRGYGTSGATVSMFDVDTPYNLLGSNGGNQAIYNDLTSGVSFGSFIHTYNTDNTANINASGINNLMANLGGAWAVGLATFNGESFGWVTTTPNQLILTVTEVPEPSTLALFALSLISLTITRSKKNS